MTGVDEAFIQAVEHRPKVAVVEAEGIPLIDLSSTPTATSDVVAEIGEACEKWGFFQVINHGVPAKCRQRVESLSRKFFEQASEEKRKVSRDEDNSMGYYDTEHTKNVRDWKQVFDFTVSDDKRMEKLLNRWPDYPSGFREACEEYAEEVEKLAYKLLELICLSLGLPEGQLSGNFKDHTSRVRLNYYPRCLIPHLALGVGRHKDSGALTVLAQDDVGGLQVKRKTDGEWILVKPVPDAYIINVGDVIQVWSNDKYESVEHRVIVNSKRERLSIPFFFNPADHAMIEPLQGLTNQHNPAKYRPYNYGEFISNRNLGNFKKLNVENIQIHDFRI